MVPLEQEAWGTAEQSGTRPTHFLELAWDTARTVVFFKVNELGGGGGA